ncbi:MAG: DUF5916 domain-containing protein, partial [Vicinamibacterales bacterium]
MTDRRRSLDLASLLVCFLLVPVSTLLAQPDTSRPTIVAVRLPAAAQVEVDGEPTEAVWMLAEPVTGFRQMEPANGEPATERTEVRLLYDRTRLLVGVWCFDSEPQQLTGSQLQRDQGLNADDRFMLTIDPFGDGRSGYFFEINPLGAMGDGLVAPGGGLSINRSWDGIWMGRAVRTETGWTAELELPFFAISFNPEISAWGINFQRTVRRKNEESLWTGYARNQGLAYMATAGRLEGLAGLSQGLGLEVRPFATASVGDAPVRDETWNADLSGGVDVFYNITPELRANLSVNTDFAETEVDQRQVNLTRFPLFFPEKRAFFLDGASVFEFARIQNNALLPFFSRRIGLDADGRPQPIAFGAKLTGQSGDYDLGAMHVRTREDQAPAEDFTVLRARRRFWTQSYAGALYTRRSGANATRHTIGVDAVLATATFLGNQVLDVSGFALATSRAAATRQGTAVGFRLNLPNDPINVRVDVREVQDGFDPAVGFVERRAYRRINPGLRYAFHPNTRVFRRYSFEVDASLIADLKNRLESRLVDIQFARIELQSGDVAEYHLLPTFERLPRDFRIFGNLVLPSGTAYGFVRRQIIVNSAARRALSTTLRLEDGAFYSGSRRQVNLTMSARPRAGWLVTVGLDDNRVRLAEGAFRTRLWRTDVNTPLSPFIA